MRSLRWLLLIVIAVVAAGVFHVYRLERIAGKAAQRPKPAMMSTADRDDEVDWEWGQSAEGKPAVRIQAKEYKLDANSKTAHLKDIELRLYQKNGKSFDRVRSDSAEFSLDSNKLYAPGVAEITLDVPDEGEPKHRLTVIKAAGINFDSSTGQAVTDQHVTFAFENGNGTCVGASYDPQTHEIHLMHSVTLHLKSNGPESRPMKVETEELIYSESAQTVQLGPWSRLTRDRTTMAAGATTVHLKDKKLDSIDAPSAKGTDQEQGKNLEYSADLVRAFYNEHGEMEKMEATGNARLISHGKTSETTMSGARLNLLFTATANDSVLSSAQARGNAFLESKPNPDPKGLTPDTKDIRSEAVDVFMKSDGRQLDRVNTFTPGTLEFLPNQPSRSRRLVKSDRMLVRYGANNEIQSYHADAASTETHPSQEQEEVARKKKLATEIATTSSKTLDATFDAKGEVKRILQTGDFRYAAGVRKAQSDNAVMDNATNVMDLDAHARIADDSGSTAADHIRIDQATGDFDARNNVETTRLPDQKPAAKDAKEAAKSTDQGGMLDSGEAMQGKADHVMSSSKGTVVHYIANAVVWQGASKILGDRIDIDRKQKSLIADGHVISYLQDAAKDGPDGKPGPVPPVTEVRAQKLVYSDTNRLAVYTGNVSMVRMGLTVTCATLQAYMNDGKPVNGKTPDSRIDRALADGNVKVVQVAAARQRVGTSQHGEYYTNEGKIVLTGGRPQLKDSLKGDVTGEKLTYFTNDDRLQGDSAPKKRMEGHIIRGKS